MNQEPGSKPRAVAVTLVLPSTVYGALLPESLALGKTVTLRVLAAYFPDEETEAKGRWRGGEGLAKITQRVGGMVGPQGLASKVLPLQ